MLTQVEIQTSTPMVLDIESVDPDEILILKSISGLSGAKNNLFLGEFAREGGYYQGRRAQPRDIVFDFKLNENYKDNITVSDIRQMLHRMFMDPQAGSDAVQVALIDDKLPEMYFIGYTEDIQADHFAKETGAQVTMRTTDPYLRSAQETSGANGLGWFTLPFTYEGSADTGLAVTLKVLANCSAINFQNVPTNQNMMLLGSFVPNDIIVINTIKGERKITKNGADIMVAMTAASEWVQLEQAANTIRVYGETINDGKVVMTDYRYRAAWWGV